MSENNVTVERTNADKADLLSGLVQRISRTTRNRVLLYSPPYDLETVWIMEMRPVMIFGIPIPFFKERKGLLSITEHTFRNDIDVKALSSISAIAIDEFQKFASGSPKNVKVSVF